MTDERGRVGKNGAACDVIRVVVGVDHILHSCPEACRKLRLEPLRKSRADRIGQDDALRRYQEHRVVEGAPPFIEIAGDVDDFPGRLPAIVLRGASE